MKKFEIDKVYEQEASKLLEAKKSVGIVHSTGDIAASGDDLEIPFREMLTKRLPSKYYVGHGHIVDSNMNVSPQFDVIIADSSATQILYDGKNGTQYFPFESVYAVGEIKSSYSKSKECTKKYISSVLRHYQIPILFVFLMEQITKANFIESSGDPELDAFEMDPLGQKNNELERVEVNFENEGKSGQVWAVLMLGLIDHLNSTMLKNPPFFRIY